MVQLKLLKNSSVDVLNNHDTIKETVDMLRGCLFVCLMLLFFVVVEFAFLCIHVGLINELHFVYIIVLT